MAQIKVGPTNPGFKHFTNLFSGEDAVTANRSFVPDYGKSTNKWTPDVSYGTGGNAYQLTSTTKSGGIQIGDSKNGNDHWGCVKYGTSQGRYLSDCITGFRFKAQQSSSSGHALYLKRVGCTIAHKTSSTSYFVDLGGIIEKKGTSEVTHTFTFDSRTQDYLNSMDYVFDEFRIQISTDKGCCTTTSSLYIWDFQYKFKGSFAGELILPALRTFGNRNTYPIGTY